MHKKIRAIVVMTLSVVLVFIATILFDTQNDVGINSVQATSTATTTVTVLNTPPTWDLTARELYASATTSPTNAGTSTVWIAQASDSNGEDYYLLICKSSSTPTPTAGGAPVCGGGSTDQWAVSTSTVSGTQARAATTTDNSWARNNDWYAYICDSNAGTPRCNDAQYNGLHESGSASATSSPFVINHYPTFTLAADDSPTLPGATTTWTTTSSDSDGDDMILHVCKSQDFDDTTHTCGPGGFWASSTPGSSNVSAEGLMTIPIQDADYGAYVYLVDEYGLQSNDTWQGSSTVLTVQNATPYVSSSTIAVYDVFGTTTVDTTMALTTEEGETDNFVIRFTVNDDNSCLNYSGGNEITDVDINIFRSGITSAGCDSSGEYDANNCYTDTNSYFTPACYQVPGTCSGATDSSAEWECTFSMWYIADPTDAGSQYAGEDWRGAARATDDNSAVSAYSEDDEAPGTASEMQQFLSFRATGTPIAYGALEPGNDTGTHIATTTIFATGNTGIDEYLSGDAMCVTYPSCTGNSTSTIYVPYQHYATTSSNVAYGSGTELSTSTSPVLVGVDVPKTTSTSTPNEDDTYWGIEVPTSITFAGDYIGRNYIDGAVAPSSDW